MCRTSADLLYGCIFENLPQIFSFNIQFDSIQYRLLPRLVQILCDTPQKLGPQIPTKGPGIGPNLARKIIYYSLKVKLSPKSNLGFISECI